MRHNVGCSSSSAPRCLKQHSTRRVFSCMKALPMIPRSRRGKRPHDTPQHHALDKLESKLPPASFLLLLYFSCSRSSQSEAASRRTSPMTAERRAANAVVENQQGRSALMPLRPPTAFARAHPAAAIKVRWFPSPFALCDAEGKGAEGGGGARPASQQRHSRLSR